MEERSELSQFGAAVFSLMVERRGIRQWKELSGLLALEGHEVSAARLSHYFHGRNSGPKWLPRAIASVLRLDNEDKQKLANAFAYGQDIPISTALEKVS